MILATSSLSIVLKVRVSGRPLIMNANDSEPRRAEETKKEEETEKAFMRQFSTCHITGQLFKPVIDPNGDTDESSAVVECVTRNGTSPTTTKPLRVDRLVPNRSFMAQLRDLSRSKRTKKHGTFQVIVRGFDNKTYFFDTDPSEKVWVLKEKIASKMGLRLFLLLWGGKQLEDEKTLADYNIHKEAAIHVVFRLKKHGSFQVIVRGFDNEVWTIDTDPSMKVWVLKEMIASKTEQTGVYLFRLLWDGKPLKDERTLADYNIHNEATIHAVFRLKGEGAP
jgi:hypothetical protein